MSKKPLGVIEIKDGQYLQWDDSTSTITGVSPLLISPQKVTIEQGFTIFEVGVSSCFHYKVRDIVRYSDEDYSVVYIDNQFGNGIQILVTRKI